MRTLYGPWKIQIKNKQTLNGHSHDQNLFYGSCKEWDLTTISSYIFFEKSFEDNRLVDHDIHIFGVDLKNNNWDYISIITENFPRNKFWETKLLKKWWDKKCFREKHQNSIKAMRELNK